jgi:hypothetical protein
MLWLVLASLAAALRLVSILLLIVATPLLLLALGGQDHRFK